jgi:hypothetical protein
MDDPLNQDEYVSECAKCEIEYGGWFPQRFCPVCGAELEVRQTFSKGVPCFEGRIIPVASTRD